jgi:ferritin-like metal-binding protein YciE
VESARELFEQELGEARDAAERVAKALPGLARSTNDDGLRGVLEELTSTADEHAKRLDRVFEMLSLSANGEPSKPIRAMLEEMRSTTKQAKAPEVVDMVVAEGANDIAQHLESSYEALLQLAERSGVTHSTPEIGELLRPSMKEARKSAKRLKKQIETLVQDVRPN